MVPDRRARTSLLPGGRRAPPRLDHVEHTLARLGAERLRRLLAERRMGRRALGAMTGGQAVQMVRAGLKAIYLSGWQVAADANLAGQTYPDQSLYPANSAPGARERINNALLRADQIAHAEGDDSIYWLAPIVADAEAGFGGPLNAFELMKAFIEAGAAAVHFEDQLSSEKKCGHLGGKVLVPTAQFVRTLVAARLAADVLDVPTLVVARTDALAARLLTATSTSATPSSAPASARPRASSGCATASMRRSPAALAYAPYADMIWCETSTPDLDEAEQFAAAMHERYPGKLLAYNCSPSFNWRRHLDDAQIATFQRDLAASATASSSSRWPASTRSTRDVRAGPRIPRRGDDRVRASCRSASSSSRPRAIRRPGTSARSAPATSTRCSRRSPAAPPRRSR